MPHTSPPVLGSLKGCSKLRGVRKALIVLFLSGVRWLLHLAMGSGPRPPPEGVGTTIILDQGLVLFNQDGCVVQRGSGVGEKERGLLACIRV